MLMCLEARGGRRAVHAGGLVLEAHALHVVRRQQPHRRLVQVALDAMLQVVTKGGS